MNIYELISDLHIYMCVCVYFKMDIELDLVTESRRYLDLENHTGSGYWIKQNNRITIQNQNTVLRHIKHHI